MSESKRPDGEDRVVAALRALERYRERRALDGGSVSDGPECLVRRAPVADRIAAHRRRRSELIERAVREDGLDRDLAADVYDIAREEGVEPAFAFELVRCGVAVLDLDEVEPEAESVAQAVPTWYESPHPAEARRERQLRTSFRRLHSLLERHATAEEALIAFAREPDVGGSKYV